MLVNLKEFYIVGDKSGCPCHARGTKEEAIALCEKLREEPGWYDWDSPSMKRVKKWACMRPDDEDGLDNGWENVAWGLPAMERGEKMRGG